MPRNGISLLAVDAKSRRPSGASSRFFVPPANANHTRGFFTPPQNDPKGGLIWPTAGFTVGKALYVLGTRVLEVSGAPFGFEIIGSDIIRVDNPLDDPWSWRIKIEPMPFSSGVLTWATAAFVDQAEQRVYLHGSYKKNDSSSFNTVMQVGIEDVVNENWLGGACVLVASPSSVEQSKWVTLQQFGASLMIPAPVASPQTSETSIFFSPALKRFVMLRSTSPTSASRFEAQSND